LGVALAKILSACAIKDCSVPTLTFRHNGADVVIEVYLLLKIHINHRAYAIAKKKPFLKERFGIFFNNSSCVEG
jgi:hypothetical protein